MMGMRGLERIWSGGDAIEGQLLRARLEADGIPSILKGEGEGPYRAGVVYLFVATDDAARARAVLDALEAGAFALEEDDAASSVGGPDVS
jgi:hypothetical protein